MSTARTSTLASLRGRIERLEAHGDAHDLNKVALGHAAADAVLRGGLAVSRCMKCSPRDIRARRPPASSPASRGGSSPRRPLVWVRQDFSELESGALSMSGLCELGLDPRLLVTVRATDTDAALRTAADALACDALGAVVLEVWGQARQLDLVASRKLTLAAQASGVTALAAAGGGGAAAFDGGDKMDRARGAFAAFLTLARVGRAGVRRATGSQPSWPGRPLDHGMEM